MMRRVAYAAMAISVGLNVGAVVGDVAVRHYQAAALQSLIVALCGAWALIIPKVDAWLDARLGEATAQRRLSELALDAMEQQMKRGGQLRVDAIVEPRDRVN